MSRTSRLCPVCRSGEHRDRFQLPGAGTEFGADPAAFRPSADRYGAVTGRVVQCTRCGHAFVVDRPADAELSAAYAAASDPVSLAEEAGQVETARRALDRIEQFVTPGPLCDLGCWTGSFLVAARERGWTGVGLEPSTWASDRARRRGLDVRTAGLDDNGLESHSFRAVVMADVLEHLAEPGAAVDRVGELLESGGAFFVTVPDAGSLPARVMGRRWWSVLPMHLQYFTRQSLGRLLTDRGFTVRWMGTHSKVFSVRYYASRLAGYSGPLGRLAVSVAERAGQADRLIAPDFRDRIAAVATAG